MAAAAVVLLALIGFGIWRFAGGDDPPRVSTPATPAPTTPAATSPQPAAPASPQPPPPAPSPAPAPTVAEAPPTVAPATPATPTTTVTPPRVPAEAIRTINALVQRDQLPQALAAAEKVIPIAPADPQLGAGAHVAAAAGAGDRAPNERRGREARRARSPPNASFREGAQAEADAASRARGGDRAGSIRALLSAAQMFGKAVNEARAINEKTAAEETARRQREAEDKRLADLKAREQADALAKQQEFERRQKEQQARVDPPPPLPKPLPGPPPGSGPAPAMTQAQEEENVRATLRAYEAAYEALDVNAVMRINPRVSEREARGRLQAVPIVRDGDRHPADQFGPARMRAFVSGTRDDRVSAAVRTPDGEHAGRSSSCCSAKETRGASRASRRASNDHLDAPPHAGSERVIHSDHRRELVAQAALGGGNSTLPVTSRLP